MEVWHLILFIACNEMLSEGSKEEIRLRKALFTDYPMVRPIDDSNRPLVVHVRLGLFQIIDLDEKNRVLSTNAEVIELWNDTYLHWKPEEFGGIRKIVIPYNSIWIPDIILYNSVSTNCGDRQLRTNAIVSYKGEVTLLTSAIFCSFCNVDVQFYPFDVQTCKLRFMSLTHDHTQIRLQIDHDQKIDLLSYAENEEFSLTSYVAEEKAEMDPCCENYFSVIAYSMRLRRRPGFFLLNYFLPMIIINVMALLSFLMPCESGEKVTLGISAMLNMVIILMGLRDVLPPTENTPLIVEVVLNIFTSYLYHLSDVRPLPKALQCLCRILARLTCMAEPHFAPSPLTQAGAKMDGNERNGVDLRRHSQNTATESLRMESVKEADVKMNRLLSLMESQEKRKWEKVKIKKAGGREGEGYVTDLQNWRTVSWILDRFFLNLFFFLNVGFSVGILFSSSQN
ncbi:unnamed protein product [Darwinula stevensoni]|uniref:Uncharacterized protein n=1 Tax=Darwinula stevensoni TaxID=69355 RepID=A0A7R8XI47_9CRUS|nr:unnamed protein product [Darwinula stevensoni]CAG0893112.1 unnamed protein product [Darwinula stevensoni]